MLSFLNLERILYSLLLCAIALKLNKVIRISPSNDLFKMVWLGLLIL